MKYYKLNDFINLYINSFKTSSMHSIILLCTYAIINHYVLCNKNGPYKVMTCGI